MNTLKILNVSILVLFVFGLILLIPLATAPNIVGPNNKNVSVWTHVNITNARPDIMNITIYEFTNMSNRNITLSAGSYKEIICNATLRDWNGYSDIINVNATLYHQATSSHNATDNNNTHYTNVNCTNSGNGVGFYVNYACNFTVIYYANNGTWACNVTATDTASTSGYGIGTTNFFPVYALNVTDGIDYGNMAVEEFSRNVSANITNLGNMAINVTVQGYGARLNDGLAMNCSLNGNITIANQRFSMTEVDWTSMTTMTGGSQLLPNLTMSKQNNSQLIVNSTYWQLYADSTNGPGGNCTGYVLFTAVAP